MDYDTAFQNFQTLVSEQLDATSDRNEATTRLQLIDRILFECLGWDKADCVCEERLNGEYADYVLSTSHRALVLEAKREGKYFSLPAGARVGERSIESLLHDSEDLHEAVEQVSGYCQKRGIPIAVVCNGHQLVAFLGSRGDGVPPERGRALVFPSLASMLGKFQELWNAISKAGITEGRLAAKLALRLTSPLPPKLSSYIHTYPGSRKRNLFQTDLQILTDLVLEDLPKTPELEDRFLRECYAQSGALSQYSLISRDVLRARYAALFDSDDPAPSVLPAIGKTGISAELVAESLARRPILLIGDVGVGKSTFVRHLIKVDAPEIFERALTFYIDLGSRAALSQDLRKFFVEDLTTQLREHYGINAEAFDFVRAVYHADLLRFQQRIYRELRATHPDRYQEKELEFLETKLSNMDEHLRVSLKHLERSRRMQIVIFIDNADQRDDTTQQAAFLIAQELTEHWAVMVFLALRPETFFRSQREGALSGYHPKAFTISPPRIDVVLSKRLALGIRVAKGEIPLSALGGDYGIKLEKLSTIIHVFQQSLEMSQDLISAIDNIAAGNVRLALEFVRTFLGSGHVDTERIVKTVEEGGAYRIPLFEFLRALIYGDVRYYDPTRSPVANLFDIGSAETREHFLLGAVLQTVLTRARVEGQSGYVETNRIYGAMQDLEFRADQIDFALRRGLDKTLLQSNRPDWSPEDPEGALRLTSKGAYHLGKLSSVYTYYDAVVIDTPVLDQRLREQIYDVESLEEHLSRALVFRSYLDRAWTSARIPSEAFDWPNRSAALAQQIRNIEVRITP